jgi:hypothetical protein
MMKKKFAILALCSLAACTTDVCPAENTLESVFSVRPTRTTHDPLNMTLDVAERQDASFIKDWQRRLLVGVFQSLRNRFSRSKHNLTIDSPGDEWNSTLSGNETVLERKGGERFNYASFDCAALVLAANKEASSTNSILVRGKDVYMLNTCAANKFVVIQLCEEIKIDSIKIGNFEFFSSMFKEFIVSVTDRYPPQRQTDWQSLGLFKARNARDIQTFHIAQSVPWAKYMRIDFLTHYGDEYYCPVSVVQVFGMTMLEEYKQDQSEEAKDKAPVVESPVPLPPTPSVPPPVVHENISCSPTVPPVVRFPARKPIRITPIQDPKKRPIYPRQPSRPRQPRYKRPSLSAHYQRVTHKMAETELGHGQQRPNASRESFFIDMAKRVRILEQNLTSVGRYTEEQAKMLKDIFDTIDAEFERLREHVDDVESRFSSHDYQQRIQMEDVLLLVSTQLGKLSDEVVFEKRLNLVLMCALFVFLVVHVGRRHALPRIQPRALLRRLSKTIRLDEFDMDKEEEACI